MFRRVEDLGARLFAARQERLGLPEVDDEVAALGAFHQTGDELTDTIAGQRGFSAIC